MWNERVGYSLSRMLITGENVELESGSLSTKILITGQNVERGSGLISEQDVNHRRGCGTRECVTL